MFCFFKHKLNFTLVKTWDWNFSVVKYILNIFKNVKFFPKRLYHFTTYQQRSYCSASLGIVYFSFNFGYNNICSGRCIVVSPLSSRVIHIQYCLYVTSSEYVFSMNLHKSSLVRLMMF